MRCRENITGVQNHKIKTKSLIDFKINQCKFISVETAQTYILV